MFILTLTEIDIIFPESIHPGDALKGLYGPAGHAQSCTDAASTLTGQSSSWASCHILNIILVLMNPDAMLSITS